MVVRMDELQKPGPKVVFLGDPFIDYYPDKQIFSGRVQNIGQVRADFVRVLVIFLTKQLKILAWTLFLLKVAE